MIKVLNCFLALLILLLAVSSGQAEVTDAKVREAIEKGLVYLRSQQGPEGDWEEHAKIHGRHQDAGTSSLVVYAMLTAGEPWQQPHMRKALTYLAETETQGTYARAFRAHVWAKLPDQFMEYLRQDTDWLASSMFEGEGYGYYGLERRTVSNMMVSLSRTQYAVLGVWEGAKRGVPVSDDYWAKIDRLITQNQNPDGGWGYTMTSQRPSDGSMTAAGLAVLMITQDYLHTNAFRTPGAAANQASTRNINRGLDWLNKEFKPKGVPGDPIVGQKETNYYRVGIERIALAAGTKYINDIDWYQAFAAQLISEQHPDGSFTAGRSGKVVDTAFALIVLTRGRDPVSINKLSIPDYDWNNRPRDIANFNAWLSDEIEKPLLWQVIDVNRPGHEWLDAPIVYLASHRPLALTEEQAENIKRYIDLGGLLVTADEGNGAFSRSVKDLLEKLYPQYTMKVAPPEDDLYSMVYNVKRRAHIETLHNGVRHLAVNIPRGDPAWALHSRSRDLFVFQLFANLFHYATEKGNIRPKLETHVEMRQQSGGGSALPIGRVRYQGQANAENPEAYANWNPEPGAWEVLGNWMFNNISRTPEIRTIDLAQIADEQVDPSTWSDVKFLHLTGTEKVTWTEAEIAGLRRYVESGGVVLLEAAGGSLDFADSSSQLVAAAFPGQRIRPLNPQTDVIQGSFTGGTELRSVLYRMFAQQRVGRLRTPRLQALAVNGQPRVIISHEDISLGLLNQPVWGIYGYHSDSARQIMTNISLWAQTLPALKPVE